MQVKQANPGECYAEAFRLLDSAPPGAVLVHGYPTLCDGPHKGRRFGHAWVEYPDEQTGQMICLDYQKPTQPFFQCLFYLVGRIEPAECKRYSWREALRMADKHGHYGPWGKQPRGVLFATKGE